MKTTTYILYRCDKSYGHKIDSTAGRYRCQLDC